MISNLLFYVICGILFLMLLSMSMTTNQAKRQWLSVLYIIGVIGIGLILFSEDLLAHAVFSKKIPLFMVAITLPQVISFVIMRSRQVVFKANFRLDWLSAIGIVFIVLIGVVWSVVFSLDAKTLPVKTLWFIPGIIYAAFAILSIYQPTAIFQDGILFKGLFWSWKDIQSYKFIGNISDKSLAKLISPNQEFFTEITFYTKKMPLWNQYKEIQFVIPERNLEFLSAFLEQRLSRLESESKV